MPVGDGCIVSSTAKAFLELRALGLTDRVPRVIGVQAAGAAPLAAAWARCGGGQATLSGSQVLAAVAPVPAKTIADSISVGIPRNRLKAWRYVAATGGGFHRRAGRGHPRDDPGLLAATPACSPNLREPRAWPAPFPRGRRD